MILTVVSVALATVFTLGSLGLGTVALLQVIRRTEREIAAPNEAVEVRIRELEVAVAGLPSLWEEERKRAKRSQDAARKDREHAQDLHAEVAEAIEGGEELRGGDEIGSDPGELHAMRQNMGHAAPSNIHERAARVAHLMR